MTKQRKTQQPISVEIKGTLQIDVQRSVVWFHRDAVQPGIDSVTALRICQLPAPIPLGKLLDVTHMHGCNWGKNDEEPE